MPFLLTKGLHGIYLITKQSLRAAQRGIAQKTSRAPVSMLILWENCHNNVTLTENSGLFWRLCQKSLSERANELLELTGCSIVCHRVYDAIDYAVFDYVEFISALC